MIEKYKKKIYNIGTTFICVNIYHRMSVRNILMNLFIFCYGYNLLETNKSQNKEYV